MARPKTISEFRAPKPYPTDDAFWRLVDRSGDCWLWRGSLKHNGYARSSFYGKSFAVHRRAYERLVGPIPEGLEIDHLCRIRHCCNPAHMEPVTHKVNTMRGNTEGALNARKTHCPQGHEYTPENTYIAKGNGSRACRLCRQQSGRQRNEAKYKRRIHFLTPAEIAFIKANYVRGTGWAKRGNARDLAERFGVSYSTVMAAITGYRRK